MISLQLPTDQGDFKLAHLWSNERFSAGVARMSEKDRQPLLAVLDTSAVRTGLAHQLRYWEPPVSLRLIHAGTIRVFVERSTLEETIQRLPRFAAQLKVRTAIIDPRRAAIQFEDVAMAWLKSTPKKRGSAQARDESIISYHLLPAFKGRPVGSVAHSDVQGLVSGWAAWHAPSTVARQFATLRAIFTYAVESELIARSPCRGIRLPQVHPRRAKIVTSEQLQLLAESIGEYGLMPYLAVALPLRWGEIAGLRVGRIDFLRQTVTVLRQRTRGTKGRMVEEDPKSEAGNRTLAVPDWLMTLLADHLAAHSVTGADSEALVFLPTEARCTIRTGGQGRGSLRPRRPDLMASTFMTSARRPELPWPRQPADHPTGLRPGDGAG